MPIFCHRVEHQNDLDPPSEFLLTSINTGIVQFLSGLTCCTHKSLSDPVFPPYPRTPCKLLGPCFNTGLISSAYSLVFSLFHFLNETFSYFLRSTYLLSVSPLYLALDDTTTSSHCTTKQCYSLFLSVSGAITLSGSPFQKICIPTQLQHSSSLPSELFLVQSPLLEKSMFVSFPVFNDMLKSKTYSYIIMHH